MDERNEGKRAANIEVESGKQKNKRKKDAPSKNKWYEIIGPSLDNFSGNCLPTNRVVMQRYKALTIENNDGRPKLSDYAETLYAEIKVIWEKTNITLMNRKTCLLRLTRLLKSWQENR